MQEKAGSSRAGPGTGSMGGKCSVCGDRATKVGSLYQAMFGELNIVSLI